MKNEKKYKTVTLNKTYKEAILKNLIIESKPKQKLEKIKTKNQALGVRVVNDILGKHKKAYENLPNNFKKTDSYIYFQDIELNRINTVCEGRLGSRRNKATLDLPKNIFSPFGTIQTNVLSKPLQDAVKNHFEKIDAAVIELNEFFKKTWGLLDNCSSTKSLLEKFPDIIGYLPERLVAEMERTNLPSVIVSCEASEIKEQLIKPIKTKEQK